MLVKIVEFIKSFFIRPMSDSDKAEFFISINKINIVRAKITTITFVILEVMMLVFHYSINRENLLSHLIYYGSMYILMLVVMIAFL